MLDLIEIFNLNGLKKHVLFHQNFKCSNFHELKLEKQGEIMLELHFHLPNLHAIMCTYNFLFDLKI